MRLDKNHLGSASFLPSGDVVAGEISTWIIEFEVGGYGIDDGGNIRFAWRSVSDWEAPQFDNPTGFGYTTVSTDAEAELKLTFTPYERPFGNSVNIAVFNGFLKKGDKVRLVLGDKSFGSPGMRAQTFCESEHEIKVLVDPFGTHRFEEMPERILFRVIPSYPNEIQAVVPATVFPGEEFSVVLRCLDAHGNPCERFEDAITLTVPEFEAHQYVLPQTVEMTKKDNGVKRVEHCVVHREGCFHISVQCGSKGFSAFSNACICGTGENKLFFGDMHGQTNFTVGTGSLDEYLRFARDVAAVDFTGWQGNDFEIDEDKWAQGREIIKRYNEERKFLTFLGYEWSGITSTGGDHNVFFLDDNESYYPSSNWLTYDRPVISENNANPITELWEIYKGRSDVMLIPHIGGRYANLDFFNPAFMSCIEIHSHHGIFEWFALEAMKRRIKTGFVASGDDHTCRPGLSYPLSGNGKSASSSFDVASGFIGVYAKELTKESIWDAIKNRRCYATTFERLNLFVTLNGRCMGEEITAQCPPEIYIRAAGKAPIERFVIYDWDTVISDRRLLPVSKKRARISWSGVSRKTRIKSANWDGILHLSDGRILSAQTVGFDRADQGIEVRTDKMLKWRSSTSGDMDGIELELEFDNKTRLHFNTKLKSFDLPVNDIGEKPIIFEAGGVNLAVEVRLASEVGENEYLNSCLAEVRETLHNLPTGEHAIWVKAVQINGHTAWSSPIFVNI